MNFGWEPGSDPFAFPKQVRNRLRSEPTPFWMFSTRWSDRERVIGEPALLGRDSQAHEPFRGGWNRRAIPHVKPLGRVGESHRERLAGIPGKQRACNVSRSVNI